MPQPDGSRVFVTAHPSYLLRHVGDARAREEAKFRADLASLAAMVGNYAEKA